MKKIQKTNKIVHKVIAVLAKKTAISGAGLASDWGWYQPKVPAKLVK